jgi:hypothetical protein
MTWCGARSLEQCDSLWNIMRILMTYCGAELVNHEKYVPIGNCLINHIPHAY